MNNRGQIIKLPPRKTLETSASLLLTCLILKYRALLLYRPTDTAPQLTGDSCYKDGQLKTKLINPFAKAKKAACIDLTNYLIH